MAYEQRRPGDYIFGTLSAQAALADATISSGALTALPTDYSTTRYLPLTLHDPAQGVYETVWVTGHALSSANVTAVRGREGTTPRAWASGSQFVCAPTVRDGLSLALNAGGLPSDAHIGARWAQADLNIVKERTRHGWGPSVGVALGHEMGPVINNAAVFPPDDAVIVQRAAGFGGPTDGSGNVTIAYRQPFPNGTIGVAITSNSYASMGAFVLYAATAAGFSFTTHQNASTSRLLNSAISVGYVAVGW